MQCQFNQLRIRNRCSKEATEIVGIQHFCAHHAQQVNRVHAERSRHYRLEDDAELRSKLLRAVAL